MDNASNEVSVIKHKVKTVASFDADFRLHEILAAKERKANKQSPIVL